MSQLVRLEGKHNEQTAHCAVLKNDGLYMVVLEVGEVHLLVLHPHHADRDHLVDLLPPPLHILPVQVRLFRSTSMISRSIHS